MSAVLVPSSGILGLGDAPMVAPSVPLTEGQEPASQPVSGPLGELLAEVKGQAQFLLYLADQLEETMGQIAGEDDPTQRTFYSKVLAMYADGLEAKHRGLGAPIAAASREVRNHLKGGD